MAENVKTIVENFDEENQSIVTEHSTKEESLGGYDFEMVEGVPKDLECIICHYVIKEAVELPCSHAFCKKCLLKWEEQKMKERSNQNDRGNRLECCQCKAPYRIGQARESKFVDRIIANNHKIKCNHHDSGCEWTGNISEYFEIHTKYCNFIEVTCLFDGCNGRFQRKQQEAHVEECGYRTLFCEHCGEKQRFIDVENHYASCPSFLVKCSNEECDMKYERNKLNVHLREECMFEIMPCPYTHIGCQSSFKRKESDTHEIQFNNKHSLLMLKQIAKVGSELEETKVALEKTTKELHDTKVILCETNKVLDETKANLEKVQNTMAENIQESLKHSEESKAEMSLTTNKMEKMGEEMDIKITQYKQQFEKTVKVCLDEIHKKTEQQKDLEARVGLLAKIVQNDLSLNIAWKIDQLGNNTSSILHFNDELFKFEFNYEVKMKRILRNMKTGEFYRRHDGNSSYLKVIIPSNIDIKTFNVIRLRRGTNHPSGSDVAAYIGGELHIYIENFEYQSCSILSIVDATERKKCLIEANFNVFDSIFRSKEDGERMQLSSDFFTANNELLLLLEKE